MRYALNQLDARRRFLQDGDCNGACERANRGVAVGYGSLSVIFGGSLDGRLAFTSGPPPGIQQGLISVHRSSPGSADA